MSDQALAMQGVSVLDFTWFGVGPITTKYLADNGADVVKIESMSRPDGLRLVGPWKDGKPDINNSQFFGSCNSSKKGLMLDMSRREARDIVRRLVPQFDVVANSFTPGIMAKWGLGYEELRQIRGDVIMLSTCMQGQTGPHAHYPGYGQLIAALSGFYYLSGYSETDIAPPHGAYTDFVVPRLAAFALLGALLYRRRTGHGQHLDISQYEAGLQFLAPAVVDYAASGTIMQPRGNRSDCYAPHGAYRGTDADDGGERWLSIAVADDQQWTNLLAVLGAPGDPRFATMIARLENQDQLDVYVQGLVLGRDVVEVAHALQSVGVAAYPVQNCLDLHSDENLLAFEFWQWLDQRDAGTMPYEGLSYRLERTGSFQTAAPSLGEHTQELLGELLGMTAREVDRLRETGVVA